MRRALKKTLAGSEDGIRTKEKIQILKSSLSDSSIEYGHELQATPLASESTRKVSKRYNNTSNNGEQEAISKYKVEQLFAPIHVWGGDTRKSFPKCCKLCDKISRPNSNNLSLSDEINSNITDCNNTSRNSSVCLSIRLLKKREDFSVREMKKVIGIIYKYDGAKKRVLPYPSMKVLHGLPHVGELRGSSHAQSVSSTSLTSSTFPTDSVSTHSHIRVVPDHKFFAQNSLRMNKQRKRVQPTTRFLDTIVFKKNKVANLKRQNIETCANKIKFDNSCFESALYDCINNQFRHKGRIHFNRQIAKFEEEESSFRELQNTKMTRDIKYPWKHESTVIPSAQSSANFSTLKLRAKAPKIKVFAGASGAPCHASPLSPATPAASLCAVEPPPTSCRATHGSLLPSNPGRGPHAPALQGTSETDGYAVREQPSTEMVHRWINQTAALFIPRINAKCCNRKWSHALTCKEPDLKLKQITTLEYKPLRRYNI